MHRPWGTETKQQMENMLFFVLFVEMKCCIANVNTPIIIFVYYINVRLFCHLFFFKWKLDVQKSFFSWKFVCNFNLSCITCYATFKTVNELMRTESSYDAAWNRNFNSYHVFVCHCCWSALELNIHSRLMHMYYMCTVLYLFAFHFYFFPKSFVEKETCCHVSGSNESFLKARIGLVPSDATVLLMITFHISHIFHHSDVQTVRVYLYDFRLVSILPLEILGSKIARR